MKLKSLITNEAEEMYPLLFVFLCYNVIPYVPNIKYEPKLFSAKFTIDVLSVKNHPNKFWETPSPIVNPIVFKDDLPWPLFSAPPKKK